MSMDYSKEVMKRFKNPKFAKKMKNPDAVGEVGNPTCILPDEKIHINENVISIKNISNNHKVLNHKGLYDKVLSKFKRDYEGKIITLKNKIGCLSLTEEHLVLAIKVPKKRKYFDYIIKRDLVPAWYHVSDLESRDIVLYPIPKETKDREYIELDTPKLKWDFRSKNIPDRIPLNNDFLRLCGYFLSEGHISEGKCRNYITISFNTNEGEYVNDVKRIVKKIFNLDVIIREMEYKKVIRLYIYSAILSRFFKKLFNKGAKNKRIHPIFMTLPAIKQRALLEGLWKGDGYVNAIRKYPRAGYSTISYLLFQQIKTLLLRQKIVFSLYSEKEKCKKGVLHKKCYRIHIGDKKSLRKLIRILGIKKLQYVLKEKIHSWFDSNYLYTPLTNVKTSEYKGGVYNLEVENFHSFTTNAFCVHNCGDVMKVYLKISKNKQGKEIIKYVSFQTFGCVAAMASSDAMCELVKGKTIDEALKITRNDIVKKLKGLPSIKFHCSVLGEEALQKAIENYKKRNHKV